MSAARWQREAAASPLGSGAAPAASVGCWVATDLGKATAAAGMTPEQAMAVKADLEAARNGFCMATDLHLTFLVTPCHDDLTVDWTMCVKYGDRWNANMLLICETLCC